MTSESFSLAWVDALWAEYGHLIMLREEDNVLILPPNRVYRVNKIGVHLIRWIEAGHKTEDFPGLNEERRLQVDAFFRNISLALSNLPHQAKRIP